MNLEIFLTNTCNMKCSFCGAWNQEEAKEAIDFEKLKKIIKDSSEKGYRYISFSGGEPLNYKLIYEAIEYANNLGFFINITTNGLLIDKEFVKKVRSKNVNTRISFHSLKEDLFNKITDTKSFNKVKESIELLKNEKVNFSIGSTIFKDNIDEIQDLSKFALDSGAKYIRFTPVYKVYKGRNFEIDNNFFEELLTEIVTFGLKNKKNLDYRKGPSLYLADFMKGILTKQCSAGSDYYIAINPDLNIVACPVLPHYSEYYSEKYDSFDNIENLKNNYRNLLDKSISYKLQGMCGECVYKSSCKGGCLSTKLENGLKLEDEQPICIKNIVDNVLKKFSLKDNEEILHYWKYQCNKKVIYKDNSMTCIRRLPIWELHFNNKYSY